MPTGNDRLRTIITEGLIERLERAFELERIVGRDVNDSAKIEPAQLVERLCAQDERVSTPPEYHETHDITNLLQEALEEETAEKRLNHAVVALGLLLAALDAPPRQGKSPQTRNGKTHR